MRVVITRPAADAALLMARLETLGHQVITSPLLTIVPRMDALVPDRPWQAIAITSANSIRALADAGHLKSIRTLTVGPQSLKAVLAAGFLNAEAHGGDVNGLAAYIRNNLDPANGPILYLSGAATAGDLEAQLTSASFDCVRVVLYDAVPATSLGETGAALREERVDAVLLYSPRTARIWHKLVEANNLSGAAARPSYLCLSQNVAAALPQAWHHLVAATPDEAAMMALLDQTARTR